MNLVRKLINAYCVICKKFKIYSLFRYLVASRNLLVNEVIIQQPPLAVGPISNDENIPVCLNCYQALDLTDTFR
jgi:hypothetical protein